MIDTPPAPSLRRNPWARVALVEEDGGPVLEIACPVRTRGLVRHRLVRPREELVRLQRRFFGPGAVAVVELEAHERTLLCAIGYLVTADEEPPPVRFACRIEDPRRVVRDRGFRWYAIGERAFTGDWVEGRRPTGYLRDARLGYDVPCWLRDDEVSRVARLGQQSAGGGARQAALEVEPLRKQLADRGHAVVRGLLSPLLVDGAQRYYGELAEHGYLRHAADGRRASLVDEALGVELHRLVTPLVRRIAAEPLRPSHSRVVRYGGGAEVRRRMMVRGRLSVVIAVEQHPAGEADEAWPLCVAGRDGREARALLAPGDALVFRGRELPHWRDGALPAGATMTALTLHYVGASYDGPLPAAETWIA